MSCPATVSICGVTRSCRRLLATATLAFTLGCTSSGGDEPTASQSTPGQSPSVQASTTPQPTKEIPQDEGGPLTALPDCEEPPPAVPADVPGLVVPDGAVVTSVQEDGPLVTVEGYVDLVPIAVRRYYFERPGLEIFQIEDEIFEAEVLYGEGEFRSYVKARATCKTGSVLTVVVGPAGSTN